MSIDWQTHIMSIDWQTHTMSIDWQTHTMSIDWQTHTHQDMLCAVLQETSFILQDVKPIREVHLIMPNSAN